MKENISDKIFIRAMVDGKWGSYSLAELVDLNEGKQAMEWLIHRATGGMQMGEMINNDHIERFVRLLPENSYVRLK